MNKQCNVVSIFILLITNVIFCIVVQKYFVDSKGFVRISSKFVQQSMIIDRIAVEVHNNTEWIRLNEKLHVKGGILKLNSDEFQQLLATSRNMTSQRVSRRTGNDSSSPDTQTKSSHGLNNATADGAQYTASGFLLPKNAYRRHTNSVDVDNVTFIYTPDSCTGKKPLYLAIFHTAPDNFVKRMNMRELWTNSTIYPRNFMRRIFVYGKNKRDLAPERQQQIKEESDTYRDILYYDFKDSYNMLSYKIVLTMKYVLTKCRGVSYVIKSDDDTLFNMPRVHGIMNPLPPSSCQIACAWANLMPVHRRHSNKWYVSYEHYPKHRKDDRFPAYCLGGGFAMTFGMYQLLYDQTAIEPWLWVDDAYFTGVLTEHITDQFTKLKLRHSQGYLAHRRSLNRTDAHEIGVFMNIGRKPIIVEIWNKIQVKAAAANLTIPI